MRLGKNRIGNNNECPLDIKTFDGSDSPYHPSVLYVEDGFCGHQWWMAQTPFSPASKPYRDRNECPQIYYSDNGINWTPIEYAPIDDLTEEEVDNLDYFSDPHLTIGPDNKLECWYRITRRNGNAKDTTNMQLVRKRSADGLKWGEREPIAKFYTGCNGPLGDMLVSPAVTYTDRYRMWFVDSENHYGKRNVAYSESQDGLYWAERINCVFSEDINPWHIDVFIDENRQIMVVYDYSDISIWESIDGINFKHISTPLKARQSIGSFYYDLYRAVIVRFKDAYRVYFSGNDLKKTYIGLMEGTEIDNLKVVNVGKRPFRSTMQSVIQELIPRLYISVKFRLTHLSYNRN